MRPLGAGRALQVFDLGDGRVLRRGGAPKREAHVMARARAVGFPVPEVLEVLDDGLVLELVEGPTMLEDLSRRPWRIATHARLLAALHDELHEIPFEDAALLHLDLHPDNVLLAASGPVVIDWTNARAGEPMLDVALSWLIARTSGGFGGRLFSHRFRACFDDDELEPALAAACAFRLADPNVSPFEQAAVRALLARRSRPEPRLR